MALAPNIFTKTGGQFTRQLPFYPTPTGQPIPAPLSNAQSNFTNNFGRTLPATNTAPPPTRTLTQTPTPTPSPYTPPQPPPQAPQSPPPQANPQPAQTSKLDPYTAYSMLLMKQLKDAQGSTDNTDLLKRQRDLQRESIRLSEGQGVQTSLPGMRGGMSPGQYGSARQAQVDALSGGIDSVAYELKKLENKRADIIEQLKFATQAGDKARESALEQEWKQKDEEYRNAVFAETKRSNLASERIAEQKASDGDGGLSAAQKAADIRSIRGAFDNEQIVKDFNTSTSSINTLRSIGTDSKNPADDIAYIYAFAKIMDPNSVVREGEYKTVQDYAQALVQRYATGIKRVVDNSNFLTQDAKQKMLKTLESKVGSQQKSYENLYKEYQRQIDDVYAGKPVTITNYGGVTPSVSGGATDSSWLTDYNYERDIKDARDAITAGADANAVKQRLLQKYQQVDL